MLCFSLLRVQPLFGLGFYLFLPDVYLGSTMRRRHCYDTLSGGASVTGYGALKKARKVAIASFYATAIQVLIVTMGSEQYCVALWSDDMSAWLTRKIHALLPFALFNSLVARRLTLLLPIRENPAIQGLRDKLVADLKPSFRYIDCEKN